MQYTLTIKELLELLEDNNYETAHTHLVFYRIQEEPITHCVMFGLYDRHHTGDKVYIFNFQIWTKEKVYVSSKITTKEGKKDFEVIAIDRPNIQKYKIWDHNYYKK